MGDKRSEGKEERKTGRSDESKRRKKDNKNGDKIEVKERGTKSWTRMVKVLMKQRWQGDTVEKQIKEGKRGQQKGERDEEGGKEKARQERG